ncbi:MAG: iron chelate uptake ABC transporter family permease subunit [Nocardioides sp.]|uniref:FecCD family ABC transporter permease n=1 Tax=Nocardioides sp. TaxID=35761 RepID=UPI0039E30153
MTATAAPARHEQQGPASFVRRGWALPCAVILFVASVLLSIFVGANSLGPGAVLDALRHQGDLQHQLILWEVRLPRTVAGVVAGISFGLAGALIQAITRNPLADPGLLGVDAGAGFAVTVGVVLFGVSSLGTTMWLAILGAAITTTLVYAIGVVAGGQVSPMHLILAGVALSAVLGGIGDAMVLLSPETYEAIMRWGLGTLRGIHGPELLATAPFFATGVLLTLVLTGPLDALALGDDLATSLGVRVGVVRTLGVLGVSLLAGSATAITGGIGFVGLMVPHVARWLTGPSQPRIVGYTLLLAPALVLIADVCGRVVVWPNELAVGVVVALVGAPVLIVMVRRPNASGL